MNLPRYELKAEKSLVIFEFISDGIKGKIPKIIKFDETSLNIMSTTIKKLNTSKIPIIRIDNKLELLKNKPIFQQKLNMANETLRAVGLPKH